MVSLLRFTIVPGVLALVLTFACAFASVLILDSRIGTWMMPRLQAYALHSKDRPEWYIRELSWTIGGAYDGNTIKDDSWFLPDENGNTAWDVLNIRRADAYPDRIIALHEKRRYFVFEIKSYGFPLPCVYRIDYAMLGGPKKGRDKTYARRIHVPMYGSVHVPVGVYPLALAVNVLCMFGCVIGARWFVTRRKRTWRRKRGRCVKCGYDMSGLESDRCPECNTELDCDRVHSGSNGTSGS